MNYVKLTILLFSMGCFLNITFSQPYPITPTSKTIDNYYGTEVIDYHRLLENLNDPKVVNWFKSQANYTDSIITKIGQKNYLFNKMAAFEGQFAGAIYNLKYLNTGAILYSKKDAKNASGKLYFRENEQSTEMLIFDPLTYKENYFVKDYYTSWDASKVVISVSKLNSDECHLVIYDLVNKQQLPQIITNANPSLIGNLSWLPDSSGFIYVNIPHFNFKDVSYLENTKAVVYKIGDPATQFKPVFSKEHCPDIPFKKEDQPQISIISKNNTYIIGAIGGASKFKDTYYSKISDTLDYNNIDWKLLFSKNEKILAFDILEDSLVYQTAKNASNFKLCKTAISKLDFYHPKTILEEHKNEVLTGFKYQNDDLYFTTLKNGVAAKLFVKSKNTTQEVKLPFAAGNISVANNTADLIITLGGWTRPLEVYKYDINTQKFKNLNPFKNRFKDFDDFVVEEIEIPSYDGAMVPVSLIYKKGLVKNGKNNTFLLSYGSYGLSFSPYFSIPFLTWVAEGGLWVIPHIRGGGEKGDAWHKAGFKTTKPNTWKDLIACTEYLIAEKYTSPKHIINYGASAGGIAVGRAITDRPDLFAVAAMSAPSLNLVRSEFQPNGPNNIKEFGSVKDSTEFRALLEMDAYHHIQKDVDYPAVIINIGMNDGIVTPWDPAKFIARMQQSTRFAAKKPVLLSVSYDTGHFVADNKRAFYKDISEIFAFSLWQLGEASYKI